MLNISHRNWVFWVLCPQERDKKFRYRKASCISLSNSLKVSWFIEVDLCIKFLSVGDFSFCIWTELMLLTSKSTAEEIQLLFQISWCRNRLASSFPFLYSTFWVVISHDSYWHFDIAVLGTLYISYIILQLSLFSFLYLLYIQ